MRVSCEMPYVECLLTCLLKYLNRHGHSIMVGVILTPSTAKIFVRRHQPSLVHRVVAPSLTSFSLFYYSPPAGRQRYRPPSSRLLLVVVGGGAIVGASRAARSESPNPRRYVVRRANARLFLRRRAPPIVDGDRSDDCSYDDAPHRLSTVTAATTTVAAASPRVYNYNNNVRSRRRSREQQPILPLLSLSLLRVLTQCPVVSPLIHHRQGDGIELRPVLVAFCRKSRRLLLLLKKEDLTMGDKNDAPVAGKRRRSNLVSLAMIAIFASLAAFHGRGCIVDPAVLSGGAASLTEKPLRGSLPAVEQGQAAVEKKNCNFLNHHGKPNPWGDPNTGLLSQSYQELVLKDIFDAIGTTNKQAVEFGFGYKKTASLTMDDLKASRRIASGLNIHRLVQQGWKPFLFDALVENPAINLHKAVLTQENIVDEFSKAGILQDADFISIDVDSVDLWLLLGMLEGGYHPRVFSIEYNPNFAVDQAISCDPVWQPWKDKGTIFGASAAAANYVAKKFGYVPVTFVTELDIFFVHGDILHNTCSNFKELPSFETLAQGMNGPLHRFCNRETDSRRLVDVPLFLEGKEREARLKAQEAVDHINQARKQLGQRSFCDESTKY